MKFLFTTCFYCIFSISMSGQSIIQATVSCGGSNLESGGLRIQSSLGQPFVNTHLLNGVQYQEGLLNGIFNAFTTGTTEMTRPIQKMEVFPNPAYSNCFLDLNDQEVGQIEVYKVDGQMVFKSKYQGGQEIQVSNLSSGIYFIKYYSKTLHSIARLIKT